MAGQPEETKPLVLIPVTAEDVFRRKLRIFSWIGGAVLVAAIATYVVWKRSTDPIHAQQSFEAGQRHLRAARFNEAVLSFDRVISLRPGFIDAYFSRAQAQAGLGERERAIADYSKVIELRPGDAAPFRERGSVYLAKKDYARAIADLSRAIALGGSAAAYNLRGIARRDSGDVSGALADFEKAVELEPNADNFFQRGSTLQSLGEHKRAIADFDQVIAFKPDIAHSYFARAQSRRALGDDAGAKADHRQGRLLDRR